MDEIEAMLRQDFEESRADVSFPLTAVVGHQEAKRALILSLINPGLSLLIYGDRGLGKKTLLMSASNFLPEISSTGCAFNCDPHNSILMCTDCRKGGWIEREIRTPFIIFPYSIDEEMLTGTVKNPQSSILGNANRGILAMRDLENYPKRITDTVFGALKRKKYEMDGFTYPCFFQPIATYNGIPGTIKENFILRVKVEEVRDVEERIEILRRVEMFRKDPFGFYDAYGKEEERLRKQIDEGRKILKKIGMPEKVAEEIRKRIEHYGLKKEYERRLIMASGTNAAYEGRLAVSMEDVSEVIRMVLPEP